jgi:Coenzyme PQQ synthesis protein D (PqqD)
MNHLPKARTSDIVMQQLADEILIYDRRNDQAYCLNSTAAFVWQNSDGETPIREIVRRLQKKYRTTIEEGVVWFALKTLKERNLLAGDLPFPANYTTVNRRQLIDVLGKSAAVAIPLVFSISAPKAINAASQSALRANGQICSSGSQCTGGGCSSSSVCCNADGRSCSSNSQCCSNFCTAGSVCQTPAAGCVLYDTPITLADGSLVKAIDVFIGQELLGVNCFSGEMIAGRVKAKQELHADEIYAITAESGDVIQCSPTHPLIAGFGDKDGTQIENFKIGNALLVHDKATSRIVEAKTVSIERIQVAQPVILFEMDTFEHTFISGGIISHNKNVPGDGNS